MATYDKRAWDAAANARAMVADAGTVATDAMDVLDRCWGCRCPAADVVSMVTDGIMWELRQLMLGRTPPPSQSKSNPTLPP